MMAANTKIRKIYTLGAGGTNCAAAAAELCRSGGVAACIPTLPAAKAK